MGHLGLATFWLGGHSEGFWKSSDCGGAGKTVKYGSGPIFVLFLGFFSFGMKTIVSTYKISYGADGNLGCFSSRGGHDNVSLQFLQFT